jgi:tetratricopeptide (TPR) repeat protein
MRSREAGLKEYFRSEIATLSAIQHPGVVAFREQGVLGDEPWYAMELLEGLTLRDLILRSPAADAHHDGGDRFAISSMPTRRVGVIGNTAAADATRPASTPRLTREQFVVICIRVLEALEHVHAHGIVHGDIKPENVFMRGELDPVLVDFGVAAPFNRARERLVRMPRSIGSVAYMPAECLQGALPDARSDLYAVGCVLYECLAGHHPLLRDTLEATVLAHLRGAVRPPSSYDPAIPRRWERLILRLLAKDPADRPGFARHAIDALTEPAARPHVTERAPSAPIHLYRSPLVGRAETLARLRARLAQTDVGDGNGKVLIRGERGMGKTRLAIELLQDALRQRAIVLRVECAPPQEGDREPVFSALRAVLSALRDHNEEAPLAEATAALNAGEEAVEALGRLAREQDGAANGSASNAALTAVIEAVRAICARRTTVLLIDDLEHSDELIRELVRRMAAIDRRDLRLMIVCMSSGSDDELEDAELLAPFESLTLHALNEADIDVAVRAMLALEHPSASLIEGAHRVSRGNPFILGLYLRTLIDSRVLQHNQHQGWHVVWPAEADRRLELPIGSVATLFDWRVKDLPDRERHIAEIAGLLGHSFEASTLAIVARYSVQETKEALDALCRHQVLEAEGAASYRFRHPLLAEQLAAQVSTPDARRTRRRAAAVLWMERNRSPVMSGWLAVHLRACGSHGKAAKCFVAAGKWYVQVYRRYEALEAFEGAAGQLEVLGQPGEARRGERLELYETIGDLALSLRLYSRAAGAYQSALTIVSGDRVRSARQHRKLASALQRDQYEAAIRHLERAMEILVAIEQQDIAWRYEWIQAHLDAMWIHYWKQRTSELLALASRIEPSVLEWGTETQRAEFDFNMAVGLMQRNRYITGAIELAHVERAMEGYTRLNDRPKITMCRFLRSMILLWGGDLDAAQAGFEAVLVVSEKATSVTIRVRALTFLCIAHRKRRDRERVRKLATAALSLANEHNMPEYRGTAMANLAWVALEDGAHDECERLIQEATAAWTASPLNVFQWTALLPLLATVVARPERATDPADLARIADNLLDESQQALPGSLTSALAQLRDAGAGGPAQSRLLAAEVIERATAYGLL